MEIIEIYKTSDGTTEVEVRFEQDTVWLNQHQLAGLFKTDRSSIAKHLGNIYKIKELSKKETCANFAQVRKEGNKTVQRHIVHYNLDAIISVGYRVNSKRGTQFRQWATQRLKDYLIKGHAVNEKRLEQLQQTIQLISKKGKSEFLQLEEAKGLLEIIDNYTQSFILLPKLQPQN
ncbi:MAG TPA: RhuM family protein [Chitinophagaceae bacterium]|nr:RhuM family protein [Chitinophagaceae bacterium]